MERATHTHPLDWTKDSKGWKRVAKGTREDKSAGRTAYPALTLEGELWAQQGLRHIHPSIHSFHKWTVTAFCMPDTVLGTVDE